MCRKYQQFHSCYALVNLPIFSTHSMKYIWYSPKESKYVYLSIKQMNGLIDGLTVSLKCFLGLLISGIFFIYKLFVSIC